MLSFHCLKISWRFNLNLDGLFRGSFRGEKMGVGWREVTSCIKLVKLMLETSYLACKYTHTFVVSGNIPLVPRLP